jgi:hypothetical protein
LGMLFEEQGADAQAVQCMAQAFVILEQLGSPDREKAGRALASLREKMGEQTFEEALREAAASVPPGPETAAAGQGMTLEQATHTIVSNTIAVLTHAPERREEWWEALGQLQRQVQAQDYADFATFLGLLRQLIEGMDPASLAPRVPPPFRQAWEAIARAIS